MSTPDVKTGLAGLVLTSADLDTQLWKRIATALEQERDEMRMKNDSSTLNVADTTLLRGEIRLAKRILARADEVGPESRQSEPNWPESAPAPAAGRIPQGY